MDRNEVVVAGGFARAVFLSPQRDKTGAVDAYSLRLENLDVSAALQVDCIPFHEGVTTFFQELEANWRGWEGTKRWQSYAGEFALEATCDKQGHISMQFVAKRCFIDTPWELALTVPLEAGQLQALVGQLAQFFRHEP